MKYQIQRVVIRTEMEEAKLPRIVDLPFHAIRVEDCWFHHIGRPTTSRHLHQFYKNHMQNQVGRCRMKTIDELPKFYSQVEESIRHSHIFPLGFCIYSGWWFHFFKFPPLLGEMIQFWLTFFSWAETTITSLPLILVLKNISNNQHLFTTWQHLLQVTCMGVSLNGGIPKTPQNDHF